MSSMLSDAMAVSFGVDGSAKHGLEPRRIRYHERYLLWGGDRGERPNVGALERATGRRAPVSDHHQHLPDEIAHDGRVVEQDSVRTVQRSGLDRLEHVRHVVGELEEAVRLRVNR